MPHRNLIPYVLLLLLTLLALGAAVLAVAQAPETVSPTGTVDAVSVGCHLDGGGYVACHITGPQAGVVKCVANGVGKDITPNAFPAHQKVIQAVIAKCEAQNPH
jgi:hypothetical protein